MYFGNLISALSHLFSALMRLPLKLRRNKVAYQYHLMDVVPHHKILSQALDLHQPMKIHHYHQTNQHQQHLRPPPLQYLQMEGRPTRGKWVSSRFIYVFITGVFLCWCFTYTWLLFMWNLFTVLLPGTGHHGAMCVNNLQCKGFSAKGVHMLVCLRCLSHYQQGLFVIIFPSS
jgi:hypothetical protein